MYTIMIERDFPKSLPEFLDKFGAEEDCAAYLMRQKWPDGFRCHLCGHREAKLLSTRAIYVCYGCRHHHSLTAGTAFEGTRKGLRTWFLAIYLMVTSKQGMSAKELQRQLGLKSYQTAWTWLHKLRRCMVDPNRSPLSGMVEVDETYIGGEAAFGEHGRSTAKKAAVACAVERVGMKTGRCRLAVIENCTKKTLHEFVQGTLKTDTTVHTDGWRGYLGLERSGYSHIRAIADKEPLQAHDLLPSVHRIFSLLKRWLLGTHQGAVSRKHLQHYLWEYEFRFNRRKSHSPTHLFQRLMEGTVRDGHKAYWQIVCKPAAKAALVGR